MSASFHSLSAGGPRTSGGKAVAARNATTHGLFARDIVLPSLGEDPEGYRQVEDELTAQIQPQNLLERHYVEKIAAASWRLRRLHRWQAQLFEDRTLTEDQRLDNLDKVLRHETHLHRQIDTAIRMLHKHVPRLYAGRARAQALATAQSVEAECRRCPETDHEVTAEARRLLDLHTADPALETDRLDAVPSEGDAQICENEPAPVSWLVKWRREQEALEHERMLASFDHDVSYRHPDGRPVYVTPEDWDDLQELRRLGQEGTAARSEDDQREMYLEYQDAARDFLAAQPNAAAYAPLKPSPLNPPLREDPVTEERGNKEVGPRNKEVGP